MNRWFCLKGEVLLQALPLIFVMTSQFVGVIVTQTQYYFHASELTGPALRPVLVESEHASS